jgi:hypothetical protein
METNMKIKKEKPQVIVWRQMLGLARVLRRGPSTDVARAVLDEDLEAEFQRRLEQAESAPDPKRPDKKTKQLLEAA